MAKTNALELARKVEAADALGGDLAMEVEAVLRATFPAEARAGQIPDGIARSSDLLEALVLAGLPGWYFSIHGRARPLGPWTCSLRQSDIDDDDEIVGAGEARRLSLAMLAAILRIAAYR